MELLNFEFFIISQQKNNVIKYLGKAIIYLTLHVSTILLTFKEILHENSNTLIEK